MFYTDPDFTMSEETPDITTGSAPGKRPLELSSDINPDSDDSSIASKRIKIIDENKVNSPKSHNAISNGGLDSPTSNGGEDRHEPEDGSNQEDQAEALPKYVMEAEPSPQPDTNGKGEDTAPASETNSGEPAPCNLNNDKSDKSDGKTGEDLQSEKDTDQSDSHEDKLKSVNVSDINPDRTESSGSCNGEDNKEASDNRKETVLSSEKDKSQGEKVNGAESDSEAMEVDVENDSLESAGTSLDNAKPKSETTSTSDPHSVSDTSVPKDSSGASKDSVDNSTSEHPVEEDIDLQNSAKDSDSNDKIEINSDEKDNDGEKHDESHLKDKEKGETENSEQKTMEDSTSDAMEIGEDNKENKEDILMDCLHLLSEEQHEARSIIMKKLQEELRNEETKLLLLKKLRLNQQQPVSVPTKPDGAASAAGAGTNGTGPAQIHRTGLPQNMAHSSMTGTKPHASIQPQSNSSNRPDMPQMMRGTHIQRQLHNYQKGHSGPPPLIMAQTSRSSSSSSAATSQSGQMVRAPVVRISTSSSASTTSTHSVSRQMQHQQQSSSRQNQIANDGQSAASRQAAAKLALRKQLEKTLLQIPPPKPPPPELHFLPSAANNEFIILVGLEEVVNTILDLDKKDKNQSKGFVQPYKCGQCNTDFTTIWKQVKMDPKQGIMCESCIVSNQKKALKAEHTNRLKTAFVKALQQEQEIEQRIQQSQSTTPQPSTSRVSSSSSSQRHRTQNVVHRSQASNIHHSSSSSSSSSSSQAHRQRVMNPAPSQRVVQQPIHYAYIPNFPVSAPQIQIIPKQHMVAPHRPPTERQREYLLDMIPSKGLGHPQNSVIWKR
nr:transcriptional repressor p66-beta-like isoform X1 [Lytechinus pictus]